MTNFTCFKPYDIRGKIPEELDLELARKVGIAYANIINPGTVIVGYDGRHDSRIFANSVIEGLTSSGVNVINIGLCGTEEVYFHTFNMEKDGIGGGIMITASHNPKGYNGIKMVGRGSTPITMNGNLQKIYDYIIYSLDKTELTLSKHGIEKQLLDKTDYISHLLSYIDVRNLKPIRILVNPANGPAGIIVKLLEKYLPFEFIYINDKLDSNFPNGIPNPMLTKNRHQTTNAILEYKTDLGLTWDGDFDRCFFFDEKGDFIEGYYIVGLLSEILLSKNANNKIIHDPRLIWNTKDIIAKYNGEALQSKSGHSFMKEKMRTEKAIYGGEVSSHHYFRDFAYCDSGMIPWLLILNYLSNNRFSLSELVNNAKKSYPCSGEINYTVSNIESILDAVKNNFIHKSSFIDYTEGISMEFDGWRFNLRAANTEALLRLNVEARNSNISINEKISEIEFFIKNDGMHEKTI